MALQATGSLSYLRADRFVKRNKTLFPFHFIWYRESRSGINKDIKTSLPMAVAKKYSKASKIPNFVNPERNPK